MDPFSMYEMASYTPSEFDHASLRSGMSHVRLVDGTAEDTPVDFVRPWTVHERASSTSASAPTGTPTLSPTSPAFVEELEAWKDEARWPPESGPSPDRPSFTQNRTHLESQHSLEARFSGDMMHPLGGGELFEAGVRDSGPSVTRLC